MAIKDDADFSTMTTQAGELKLSVVLTTVRAARSLRSMPFMCAGLSFTAVDLTAHTAVHGH